MAQAGRSALSAQSAADGRQRWRIPLFDAYGRGDPNAEPFSESVGTLYAMSYALKMLPKRALAPKGYYEYAVFPLEGVWDIADTTRRTRRSIKTISSIQSGLFDRRAHRCVKSIRREKEAGCAA